MDTAHVNGARGFTLIELLTVIAVIGILAALILPSIGKVRESAQRAVDGNNLRELAKAAVLYANDNRNALPNPDQPGRAISGGSKYQQWLGQLARYAGHNDPALLVSKSDAAIDPTAVPASVLDPANPNALLAGFATLPATSFNVIGGLRLTDPATTPLAYTRGLRADGTWRATGTTDEDVNVGPYRDQGGHILFLGGHVQFFPHLQDALIGRDGRPTSDLREALPQRAGVRIYGTDEANGLASEGGRAIGGTP